MIILIAGASHTGKTLLAQKLLTKYGYPYLSIDHLKMGLIRSGYTKLTPMDDDKLTPYLWPIIKEIIKTAIENKQNLIIEGCYIPFNWKKDFDDSYLNNIRYKCLIMSKTYIEQHLDDIVNNASAIECRYDDSDFYINSCIKENEENLVMCQKYDVEYLLIDNKYQVDIDLL